MRRAAGPRKSASTAVVAATAAHPPLWCCTSTTLSIFCWDQRAAPEFSLRRRGTLAMLMALGELHGRNRASALRRSRVHNGTRDRGGKSIRLVWPWAFPLVGPEGPGALSKGHALASVLLAGRWRCRGRHLQGPRDAGQFAVDLDAIQAARMLPRQSRLSWAEPHGFVTNYSRPAAFHATRRSLTVAFQIRPPRLSSQNPLIILRNSRA